DRGHADAQAGRQPARGEQGRHPAHSHQVPFVDVRAAPSTVGDRPATPLTRRCNARGSPARTPPPPAPQTLKASPPEPLHGATPPSPADPCPRGPVLPADPCPCGSVPLRIRSPADPCPRGPVP